MMPSPRKATFSGAAMATSSRCLDSQPIAGAQCTGGLRRQLVPVQQVATARAVAAAVRAARRMPPPLGQGRVAHAVERLDLADAAVAAGVLAVPAAVPPQRVLDRAQRE